MKVLLLAGGAWYHDQPAHRTALWDCLGPHFDVTMSHYPEGVLTSGNLARFDAVADYSSWWEPSRDECLALTDAVAGGLGFASLHPATASFMNSDEYHDMVGGVFVFHDPNKVIPVTLQPRSHYHTEVAAVQSHPITEGLEDFEVQDELYVVDGDMTSWRVLARALSHPVAYTKPYGAGRVFCTNLGHDERALGHPAVQQLYVRGIRWVARQL